MGTRRWITSFAIHMVAAFVLSAAFFTNTLLFAEQKEQSEPVSTEPDGLPIMPSAPPVAGAKTLGFGAGGKAEVITAAEEPILKRIDVNKIGATPYYETFEGLRLGPYFPAKYFQISQRVEIYQEAKPIDAHIMDAKKIRWLHYSQPWNTKADYRAQANEPIFTRAYGTEITMNDPKSKEGQWKYTKDYRDIYGNQFPVYVANPQSSRTDIDYTYNTNYKHEQWDQNEIMWMYSRKIPGIDWGFTANAGYRYSTMSAKNDGGTDSYYENRHTIFAYSSIAPTDRMEFFGQFEYFKSHRPHSDFIYNPDHWYWATELRMRSMDYKTLVVPRISYSKDIYFPFHNRFNKTEMQFRIGHDFTKKFNATTTLKYVLSIRNEVDNTAPTYGYIEPRSNPINDMAAWIGTENRAQYNFFDRLWLQGGVDYSAGTNMCAFDNYALVGGLEYYAPGILRVDVGWKGNHYYNIETFLSTVYFKVYVFM